MPEIIMEQFNVLCKEQDEIYSAMWTLYFLRLSGGSSITPSPYL